MICDVMIRKVLNHIRKKLGGKGAFGTLSYSQCGEDMIVKYVFGLRRIGRPSYMDIGAHHPWFINNTAHFYETGCRGINIDPNPDSIRQFEAARPGDINLNVGISDKVGEADFFIMSDAGFSTFSKQEADNFVSEGHFIREIRKVKLFPVGEIIGKYAGGKFPDFLSIDVEGLELEILKRIEFSVNYPKVICVETAEYSPIGAGKKRKGLMDFVESKGYYLYADTNLNSIYVKNEFWHNASYS
jgi:FkbM family methyltransferase